MMPPVGRVGFVSFLVVWALSTAIDTEAALRPETGIRPGRQAERGQRTALPDVSGLTSTRVVGPAGQRRLHVDWILPTSPSVAGVLVMANISPVTQRPRDRQRYRSQTLANKHAVICITQAPESGCVVEVPRTPFPVDDDTVYLKAFTFDASFIYSVGAEARSLPIGNSGARWTYWTGATQMPPAGVIADRLVVISGNDQRLHRTQSADGTRSGWVPVSAQASASARILAGDLNPLGVPRESAFASFSDGSLRRYRLDQAQASHDALAAVNQAGGCSDPLTLSPAIALDAFDTNANNADDAVIVASTCFGSGNALLLYDFELGLPRDAYRGGVDGLGAAIDNPAIWYRASGNNLVFLAVDAAGGESLLAIELAPGPSWATSPYAETSGIGALSTAPTIVPRESEQAYVLVGNREGELIVLSAFERDAGALRVVDRWSAGTDSIGGIGVSNRIVGAVGLENWVVWASVSGVHGVKLSADGTFDRATRWDRALTGAGAPLVLRNTFQTGDSVAIFGTSNGLLVSLDATTGNTIRELSIAASSQVSAPSFDFGDGTDQGIVVTTSVGGAFWIPLNAHRSPTSLLELSKPPATLLVDELQPTRFGW